MIELDGDGNVFEWYREALDKLEGAAKAIEAAKVRDVVSKLVTPNQIAEAWGMNNSALTMVRYRHSRFPEPVGLFGRSLVFWAPDVDEFMRVYMTAKSDRLSPGVARPSARGDLDDE